MASKSNKTAGNKVPERNDAPVTGTVTIGGKTYARKAVTLPFLLVQDGTSVTVRIDGVMHKAKEQPVKAGAKKMDEPMTICLATAMESVPGKRPIHEGRQYHLICNKVIASNLAEQYPGDGYVGKVFQISNNGKQEGKRHKDFEIAELVAE